MINQAQDELMDDFINNGNLLYDSGQYDELIGFCNELLKIVNDERIHTLLERAESALENAASSKETFDNTVSFPLENGITITGYKNEFIMNSILLTKKYYEQSILKAWFKYGVFKTVFDVGANIGNHTLFFASNSPDAEVYSFEPMPVNYKVLESNIINNSLINRVHLYNKAVGSQKGTVRMKIGVENNNGTAQITEEDNENLETVEVVAIDDLELPVPDFIKIDTEGYEIQVLNGMKNVLQQSNALVWLEIDSENAMEVYQIMDGFGYEVLDYSLLWANNVLFGKMPQEAYPLGYAFARLLEWAEEMSENFGKLLTLNSPRKE